jgi:hypothetical protein
MEKKIVQIAAVCLFAAALGGGGLQAQAIRESRASAPGGAAGAGAERLPLRRLALFSSGVGYFEHSGTVSGPGAFRLTFNREAVNDALKSLAVNDPNSTAPAVRYASEDTLYRTLRSLSVDLSGNPGIAQILDSLKGAELEIAAPRPLSGRIIGVEYRAAPAAVPGGEERAEAFVSLFSGDGIRVISLREAGSFSFKDPALNADLSRALDLLRDEGAAETRDLLVELEGEGARAVALSYVIPAPVWKVSYRLDLSGGEPLLQGWAIVDNDGDTDWENVELSLVTGRPVSFIQNLYPPLRLSRPVLPLAIAGIARAETHDSSWSWEGAGFSKQADAAYYEEPSVPADGGLQRGSATWYRADGISLRANHATLPFGTRIRVTNLNNNRQTIVTISGRIPEDASRILDISQEAAKNLGMTTAGGSAPISIEILGGGRAVAAVAEPEPPPEPQYEPPALTPAAAYALVQGALETAGAAAAGDRFEFTLRRPVSLARRQSAMFPLVEGTLRAEKALVFSGARMTGRAVHPVSGAELVNTTGMKLPAGPLTVYEAGTYAGDALMEFFPAGEKRLVSWGEDLAVSGSAEASANRFVTTVTLSKGLMTINRKLGYEKTYTLRNASGEEKRIILEHPVTAGAELAEPASFEERTGNLYRFTRTLPAGGELSLRVREESPLSERVSLSQLRLESLVSYASNQEIPPPVRAALQRGAELRRETDLRRAEQQDLESRRTRLIADQDRARKNLEAAGSQTQQGQDYLRRMTALDEEIDALSSSVEEAARAVRAAQAAYDDYLGSLEL